jgi:hypothetical protein
VTIGLSTWCSALHSLARVRTVLLAATLVISLLTSCGLVEGKDTAEKAVVLFHEQFNAESYNDMYTAADADFRRATTLADLTQLFQAVHRKLGLFTTAEQTNSNVFASTGAPTTVTLVYTSQFADGKATEQFKFSISGSKAFLLAYNINSPTLILK